jgi:hypothetical protein
MNPLLFRWEGDCFKPIPRHAKDCDARYVIGEHYALEEIQERSSKTHAHYFASVSQGWANLREDIADHWPTAEHLRKWCLIKSGYHNHRSIVAKSKAEALRLASFIRPMDDFAIVTVNDCVVDVFTAKSQSHRAMNRQEFAKSKEAVLAILAQMIDTSAEKLEKAGEAA